MPVAGKIPTLILEACSVKPTIFRIFRDVIVKISPAVWMR